MHFFKSTSSELQKLPSANKCALFRQTLESIKNGVSASLLKILGWTALNQYIRASSRSLKYPAKDDFARSTQLCFFSREKYDCSLHDRSSHSSDTFSHNSNTQTRAIGTSITWLLCCVGPENETPVGHIIYMFWDVQTPFIWQRAWIPDSWYPASARIKRLIINLESLLNNMNHLFNLNIRNFNPQWQTV